jgi:predicted alpha/beta hydrolase family esterase
VIVGALGGIDSESGFGPWLEGETLLAELLCRACA